MPKFIDERALAADLMVSVSTVRGWRYEGKGPKYLKVGGAVRYRESDVMSWLDAQVAGGREVAVNA